MATGIYVHIPFCVSKCAYCDFYSAPCGEKERSEYVSALCRQIAGFDPKTPKIPISTVFFGGGTPSLISPKEFSEIAEALYRRFDILSDAEFTVEANPGTLSKEKLSVYREYGVNRISLGAQSFCDRELKFLSRIHTEKETGIAVDLTRNAGFDNISLDLMYGFPTQTPKSFERSLILAEKLSPEHISVYGLQLEEGTRLYREREKYVFPDDDEINAENQLALDFLTGKGYKRYEISNYAKPGKECRHNLNYWNMGQYLGFGVASHSFYGGKRFFCEKDTEKFIKSKDFSGLITVDEALDAEDFAAEYVMVRLRLCEGLSLEKLKELTPNHEKYINRTAPYVQSGFMENDGAFLRFTEKGFNVSNTILSDILF